MINVSATTVYDAVQRLQPNWLSSRRRPVANNDAGTVPNVFIGGTQVGDVTYLRAPPRPDDVETLRYHAPGEAGARFGMGHQRGVIEVVMRGETSSQRDSTDRGDPPRSFRSGPSSAGGAPRRKGRILLSAVPEDLHEPEGVDDGGDEHSRPDW